MDRSRHGTFERQAQVSDCKVPRTCASPFVSTQSYCQGPTHSSQSSAIRLLPDPWAFERSRLCDGRFAYIILAGQLQCQQFVVIAPFAITRSPKFCSCASGFRLNTHKQLPCQTSRRLPSNVSIQSARTALSSRLNLICRGTSDRVLAFAGTYFLGDSHALAAE
jgi:hypothetical protein